MTRTQNLTHSTAVARMTWHIETWIAPAWPPWHASVSDKKKINKKLTDKVIKKNLRAWCGCCCC